MTARLDIRWRAEAWRQETVAVSLVRHITSPKPELRCPACDSILYSRRSKFCGVCGEALPEELRFTPFEANRVKHLLRTERERHRIWMQRRDTACSGASLSPFTR
jgi:predicted nucleic acid-binding Zn ribbon protein